MRGWTVWLTFVFAVIGVLAALLLPGKFQMVYSSNIPPVAAEPAVLAAFTATPNLPDINVIFDMVNAERALHGAPSLQRDPQLTAIAEQRGADMTSNHYYAHKGSDGRYFDQLVKASRYKMSYGCENLDLQFSVMPEIYIQDWLKSKAGHRECLLNSKTTRAGYAVVRYDTPNQQPTDPQSYIVVAIHAQP